MTASHGDSRWAELRDEHDRLAWDLAGRTNGTIVKNTGDGVLARFEEAIEAAHTQIALFVAGVCTVVRGSG